MTPTQFPSPQHPNTDVPEPFEPGSPPLEPDVGPVPAPVPQDPQINPVVAAGATPAGPAPFRQLYGQAAACP